MPPRRTPAAPAEPATAPHAPSVLLRSAPSRNNVMTIDSAAGEQQEAAERDDVRVDDPGEVLLREVQALADAGQCDVDDRCVEDDDELRDAQQDQGGPAAVQVFLVGGHSVAPFFASPGRR